MAAFLHGIETIEIQTGAVPIRQVRTAVIGLVGTAPMLDVEAGDRTLNELQLVTNRRDAARYFGNDYPGFTIPQSLDAIFDQGAGIVYVVNVLDPATDTDTVEAEAHTFGSDYEITLAHPQVSSVVVTSVGGATTYVAGDDYTLDAARGKLTLPTTGSDITPTTALEIDYTFVDPSAATDADIIGTTDVGGNRTGMQAFLDMYNTYGLRIKTLIAPGYSATRAVWTEMITIAERERAIAVVDMPVSATFTDALESRGINGDIDFNSASDRLVPIYPYVKRLNLQTNTDESVPYSPYWAGAQAKRDNERGYWWSASNTEISGITGFVAKLTGGYNDPNSEANLLNEVGIVTYNRTFGSGYRTWGNRSAAWPSVTRPNNFISVRRVADILHESLELSIAQFLDFPMGGGVIDAITESVNAFLRTLQARGAIIGGECTYNPDLNPPTQLALGQLVFSLEFMPPPPTERITFESTLNINLLSTLGQSLAGAA